MQLTESNDGAEPSCDIVDENATAKVKRRPFGSALRSSPVSQAEAEVDEHTELLSSTDAKPDQSTTNQTICTRSVSFTRGDVSQSSALETKRMYPEADSVHTVNECANRDTADPSPIKGFIHLTVPGIGDLVPRELESAERCCWASVQRTSRANENSSDNNQDSARWLFSRRLFAFPGRQLEGTDKRSPREWLHVMSWDFADLNPGRISTFDADRLLVVDATTGTLSYITWPDNRDKPTLHRVTRPKSRPIRLICTNHHVKAAYPPVAYFVSGLDLYSFQFN
ncbi:hypothetical protein FGIG_00776 [Fasciola gigantica]|uniref:DUF5736 domain-containing protein n=1 Tax=Fasciola gigantica TaxID=46835 RepID=A0A504Z5Z4_FASGI|nr:hypothetical protein FGIG_00776 [Fasciola gigantica]